MFEDIAGLLTGGAFSSILGGVTGLVGTWLKAKHDREMFKLNQQARADERIHEIRVMKQESDAAIQIAEVARAEANDAAASQTLSSSYKTEPKLYHAGLNFPDTWYGRWLKSLAVMMMFLLDFMRGSIRPGLTVYLAIIVTLIYWEYLALVEKLQVPISATDANNMLMYLVMTFCYLFTTMVLWWFGTRNNQTPPKSLGR